MGSRERATKTMQLSEVKDAISGVIDEVRQDSARVLVEENGILVAALISATDLERLVRFERRRAEQFKVIDEVREAFKDVPPEEIERETDRIIARIRAEDRAAREALATPQ
jgi:PHD/YefM family antitoxin component YafN of YafNO toxin-antitoxin module